jgi:N-ethylmaleimide reductase
MSETATASASAPPKVAGAIPLSAERADPARVAHLFEPYRLSDALTLRNRILLAPCTRNCAEPGAVPTVGAASYYAERASAGLLITEATMIRADTQGYRDTPGIWSAGQIDGWRRVTEAVHRRDGMIFVQLWHLGRLSHPYYTGRDPSAPSVVTISGPLRQTRGIALEHVLPRALEASEIPQLVEDYAHCAANAAKAGFDGVEIHAANGYLPDQFLRQHTNRRTDAWGGSAKRRARFALEVVDACSAVVGAGRVGIRLSPAAYFGQMEYVAGDNDGYLWLLRELERRPIAYVHNGIIDDRETYAYLEGSSGAFLRRHYRGTLVGNGAYGPNLAADAIAAKAFDLIAFGRLFIANPDLVERVRGGLELHDYARPLLDLMR